MDNYDNSDYSAFSNTLNHQTQSNHALHISKSREGSVSGVSSLSSYSLNRSNSYSETSYKSSSPKSMSTTAGRPPHTFTTSDHSRRFNPPTLPTSPSFTSPNSISFRNNYTNYGLPSPPISGGMTQPMYPSNATASPLSVPTTFTPSKSSCSSYSYNHASSNYGMNSYVKRSNSYAGHDNASFIEPRPSNSSTTSRTMSTFIPRDSANLVFPPTDEALAAAVDELAACKSSFKVIYAGDGSYKETGGLYNKTKRVYFVLTNNLLLYYKNVQKSRNFINMFEQSAEPHHIFLNLAHVYAVQATTVIPNTFRIEYINPKSGVALHHKITVSSEKEMKQWVRALRKAIKVHHPEISRVTPTERHNVLDRLKKQNDLFENANENQTFKIVYKEFGYRAANETPKELFLPMLLSIGKFSFYLTPIVPKDQVYEKAIERDRFGLLSIQSIRFDNVDDTVILDIKRSGKPNLQLAFASTFCESIVQYLYRGVQALVPPIAATLYDTNVPSRIKNARVIQHYIHPDPGDTVSDDEEIQKFHTVLRAYSAAMNLNKQRFNFTIHGPMKAKAFSLLSPHEINRTPPTYDKFELLALIKTVQYNNIFSEVSFANQPLNILERWERKAKEGWTFSEQHQLKDSNVLANEIYNMLTNLDTLSKIDLTNCSIGENIQDPSSMAQSSALAQIGHVMRLGKTNVTRICIGKNVLTDNDFSKLVQGIREYTLPIKELRLNECGLEKNIIQKILKALYDKQPEQMVILDLSLSPEQQGDMMIHPALIEKLVVKFTGLESLYMHGHNLLDLNYNFMLERSSLIVLDVSGCNMTSKTIQRLCHWIQSRSFDNIKELHLGNCNLTGKHATDILNSISRARNKSIHLNLENNPLMKNPGYLHQLVAALTHRPGPTSLSLARIKFDDFALREFVEGLSTNQTITHLDLSDLSMSDTEEISIDTIRQLALLFEKNKTLKSLDFHHEYVKAKHVAFSATQTKSLLGNALVKAFQGLLDNTTLNHLNISGMNIEDSGAMALCRVLEKNKGLQSIRLDENNISIDAYKKLSSVIEENAIQVVHLPHPYVDLRNQLKFLLFRQEDLLIAENEARFFLIHTTGGEATRATKHKLEMVHEEMKSGQLAIKNFASVLEKLQRVVQKNLSDYERRRQLEIAYLQQKGVSYIEEQNYHWDHPGYHTSLQGSEAPTIDRRLTMVSLSSSSSSSQKLNEFSGLLSPPPLTQHREFLETIPPTEDSSKRDLEDIIEQQKRILMQLELKHQPLQTQPYPDNMHQQHYAQKQHYVKPQVYPSYEHYQQQNANYYTDDFSYADDFVQYSSSNEWNSYFSSDTRD